MSGKKWSTEEKNFLIENYGIIPIKEIAKQLNRSLGGTKEQVRIFNLKGSRLGKRIPITQEEIDARYEQLNIKCLDKYYGCDKLHKYICKFCDKEFQTLPSLIFKGTNSCGCTKIGSRKGTEIISATHFGKIKQSAKRRNIEFNITIEYISDLLIKQDFKCALTGIHIEGGYFKHGGYKIPTCSLDRIDSSKGYIEGNVQWLFAPINTMKMSLSQEDFINYCKLIAERHK